MAFARCKRFLSFCVTVQVAEKMVKVAQLNRDAIFYLPVIPIFILFKIDPIRIFVNEQSISFD